MQDHVLIVDDDPAISKLLERIVRSNDMDATVANCGKEALALLGEHTYDIILMDVMLGDMEGFDVIKRIRGEGNTTPVMIISGRNEDFDSLYGLSLGADDYVTKPFRPLVVGAKIKAMVRRNKHMGSDDHSKLLEVGPFSYDSTTMRFYKNGEELILSAKEGALMLFFMQHPQQVFTKDMIYEQVWGTSVAIDDNAIMVYINRLRSKIEDDRQNPQHIVTLRGLGYRFVP